MSWRWWTLFPARCSSEGYRGLDRISLEWSPRPAGTGLAMSFIFWTIAFKSHIILLSHETALGMQSLPVVLTAHPYEDSWGIHIYFSKPLCFYVLSYDQVLPQNLFRLSFHDVMRQKYKASILFQCLHLLQENTIYNWNEMDVVRIMVQAQSNKRTNEHWHFPPIYKVNLWHKKLLSHWRSSEIPSFLAAYQVCSCN